jgi:serine/threonine protein kinase
MSNKIGRFEILSEIATSIAGSVYKATDEESNQTVALKTLKLEVFGMQAEAVVQSVVEEAELSKALNSPNIALLYGAGEIDFMLCAAMEYVQGNSIATMLARKEGFSIWDLMDIARQTCQGLDHALVHKVVHYSLEPAKIMVQWDGTVKILSFGTSMMGAHAAQAQGPAPEVLHYMSPEQLRADPLDSRSNFFSLAAILYEMVTERKAFQGDDAEQVRQSILEMTPVAPDHVNPKIHPALSEVIMKALSKDPDQRYQCGQDLINDLERCKESATKTSAKKATPTAPANTVAKKTPSPTAAKPNESVPVAAAAKPVHEKPRPEFAPKPVPKVTEPAVTAVPVRPPVAPDDSEFEVKAEAPEPETPVLDRKAAAAAAGWGGSSASASTMPRAPKLDSQPKFGSKLDHHSKEEMKMSAATADQEVDAPAVYVDPTMSETKKALVPSGPSFSEISELPPLKEVYVAPAPTAPSTQAVQEVEQPTFKSSVAEKPKIQPREVAKKAVTEIKKTPPKLVMYSVAAAIGIVLLLILGIAFHIHNENSDDDSAPAQSAQAPAPAQAAPAAAQPAVAPAPAPAQVITTTPLEAIPAESASVSVTPKHNAKQKKNAKALPAAAPVVVPGQLSVNSTPEGAAIAMDGHGEAGWVTPFNLTGLAPGQHTITVSRPGFGSETRTIEVGAGSKSFLSVQLAQLSASLSVTSDPVGASIFLDGKDTGHVTPTQLSVEKAGNHTILVKKQGYLDETSVANLQTGQTFHYSPTLRRLGSTDEIKTINKFKKVFGGGDVAGMGTVSIRTNPKGAQIAVNRRVLDKVSPVDFYLNPGTYVVDITLSGFQSVQKVVTVDKGGKVAIDEALQRQ